MVELLLVVFFFKSEKTTEKSKAIDWSSEETR